MAADGADPRDEREQLRARLFLGSVLPLVQVVLVDRPAYGWLLGGGDATVQIEAANSDVAAWLGLRRGALEVRTGRHDRPDVRCRFRDVAELNAFFAGRRPAPLPRIVGLRHALALARLLPLLSSLRLLTPVVPADAAGRALKVKLTLYAATLALSQLHRGGHPAMRAFAARSPDRVYQWTVEETRVGAYLRVAAGRTRAGRGTYPLRRPFVHFVFPTVDAACRVFTRAGSQMEAVTRGDVRTDGSPEYSRRISGLLQTVDALLMES